MSQPPLQGVTVSVVMPAYNEQPTIERLSAAAATLE